MTQDDQHAGEAGVVASRESRVDRSPRPIPPDSPSPTPATLFEGE